MEVSKVMDCDLPPIYKCACTEPESIFCDLHATEHIKLDGSHVLLTNYIGLVPWRIALSIQCSICIKKYRAAKNKVIQVLRDHIQKLSQMTLKFIEETTIMETLHFEAVAFMTSNDKIINNLKYTPVEEFILKYLENPNEIGSHFLQNEVALMKEIDLKTRLDESNEKIMLLNEEVKKRIKEVAEVKQKFEKANKLKDKSFNKIKSNLEKIIYVKNEEAKKIKEENDKEINNINQSLNEFQKINKQQSEEISNANRNLVGTTKLNEKYMKEILEMKKKLEKSKHTIELKDKEFLNAKKQKTEEISALNKALVEIKAGKKKKNKEINELQAKIKEQQTRIKEIQIINDQKNKEINEIGKKLKEIQQISQNNSNEFTATIEQKNLEIRQLSFNNANLAQANSLIIKEKNEEMIKMNKKLEESYKLHQGTENTYKNLIEEKNYEIKAMDEKLKQAITNGHNKDAENRGIIIEWSRKFSDIKNKYEESLHSYEENMKKYQVTMNEKNTKISSISQSLKENIDIFEQKNEENERIIQECRKQYLEIYKRFEEHLEASNLSEKKFIIIIEEKNAELNEMSKRYEEALNINEQNNKECKIIIEESNKKLIATMIQLEEALKANKLKDKELTKLCEQKSETIKELIRLEFKKVIEDSNVLSIRPNLENNIVQNIRKENESKFLCYFENNSKDFCVIDIITQNDTRTTIDIPDNLSMYTGFCELPDEKWFFYSNSGVNCAGVTYIFDIKQRIGAKHIDHLPKKYIGSCCYLNNCVYSFGGNLNEGSCTNSEKFDLSTHKWQEIQPVPAACTSITTTYSNTMIVISSLQLKNIIEYDTIGNTYKTYLNGNFSIYHAVLASVYGNIYLFKSGSLWDITHYQKNALTQIKS